jgi:cysteine synthase A
MRGAIHKAELLKERNKNVVILNQFENEANPDAHRLGTAMEILEDTGGDFDAIVAGVGTSGTITGLASVLKTYNQDLSVVAVEPKNSAVLNGKDKGLHKIQGIGAGFVPPLYNKTLVNEILDINDEEAIEMAKLVSKTEGLLIGISAAAAVVGAVTLAKRQEFVNKRIIAILPDSVERYLSTGNF